MNRLLALMLVGLGLTLGACGDDDDDGDTGAVTVEEATTPETTAAEEALEGTGKIVELAADPGGDLAYQQEQVTAEDGKIQIEFTNESDIPHDVVIENDAGEELARTDRVIDGQDQATVNLTPGTYTFYCSVTGHREAGMEGPLTIE